MKRVAILGLVAVVFAELASAGLIRLLGLRPPAGFSATYRARDERPSPLRPHPFFGPTVDKAREASVNDYGFVSPVPYPYQRQPQDFVIGIFGGSVASHFASMAMSGHLLDSLGTRIPELAHKRIVALNLALELGKQPQQFYIAAYFLPMIDLAINIDGGQEMRATDLRYPADYPVAYHSVYGPGRPGPLDRMMVAILNALPEGLTQAAVALPPLSWSNTYFLVWTAMDRVSSLGLEKMRKRLLEAGASSKFPQSLNPREGSAAQQTRAAIWERYTVLEHELLRMHGKRAFFFIEPREEVPTPGSPDILKLRAANLRRRGIPVFDSVEFGVEGKLAPQIIDLLAEAGAKILPNAPRVQR